MNSSVQTGSEVHLDEWVGPGIVDSSGYLRPGKILEWMDVVGVIVSSRYARAPVVTASVDGLVLTQPIQVGSRVTMTAKVGYTSARTIGVCVNMDHIANNAALNKKKNSVKGYMVFVALGDDQKPISVPQFVPGTPSEEKLYNEGLLRQEFRAQAKEKESGQMREEMPWNHPSALKEMLKQLPKSLRAPWERPEPRGVRSRHYSYIHKIEPVFAGQLNFTGTLYGGTLVKWVETAAHLSAKAFLDGADVTMTGLHGLNFLQPVKKNVFLHIRSHVVHTTDENLTVLTEVQAEDPVANEIESTLRAFLTYRPLRKVTIPNLPLDSEDDRKLFREVNARLELHKKLYL